ncbi:11402_t:CDS:2, partial [Rhizophagus irregularis]
DDENDELQQLKIQRDQSQRTSHLIDESEYYSSRHNLTTLQVDSSSAMNDTINEKKHQIDVKEIEFNAIYDSTTWKKVQFSYNNTNNITLEQNDKHQQDVVRKCVSTLSTRLKELKSCAQALEAIKSLEHS